MTKTGKPFTEIYEIETKYEVLSGEELDNSFRKRIEEMIQEIINDLHIVFTNVESYKAIASEEGDIMRRYSPGFVSSYVYSSISANILIISNLFDNNSNVLSLYKIINYVEANRTHLETRLFERKKGKDANWEMVCDGKLQKEIIKWRRHLDSLAGNIMAKIDILRDKVYAHKDIDFKRIEQNNYFFTIEDFEEFINSIFEFVNEINSAIFYSGYAFFDYKHPDIIQSLNMINCYKKYKKEILSLLRKVQ